METIKGDLILEEDTTFKESIKVEGNIKGIFNLKVEGDIDAENIDAWDIVARDIVARDIVAWDIDARDIICEKRIKKSEKVKTICRIFIQDKSKIERGEKLI